MLIKRCICGRTEWAAICRRNGLSIAACACGVMYLYSPISAAEYQAQYCGSYHRSADRHPGCIPYAERYAHDTHIADLRWRRYLEILGARALVFRTALDVGAANGAFVDYLVHLDFEAIGIDPDPASRTVHVQNCRIDELTLHFDLITYHDVLEHILDPAAELQHAADRLEPNGVLVIDVPDVSVLQGAHHFKAEHPWYFTLGSLEQLVKLTGLKLLAHDFPIPGKLVVYAARA
jgi:SAM-dependent methyltransferase